MAKVYCFSSTGNSLYVAKQIAARIGGEVISMSRLSQPCADELIGFVFPVFFCGLPKLVETFLSGLEIQNKDAYIFTIVTYGGITYGISGAVEKLLRRKGVSVQYSKRIKSVENYTFEFRVNDSQALHQRVDVAIEKIAKEIVNRAQNKVEPYTVANALLYARYPGRKGDCDKHFSIMSSCTGCGICQRICPAGSITLQSGQPGFLHRCEHCLACVHACPCGAIQWKRSAGKGRYRNPHIELAELIAFCGQKQEDE